MGKVTVEVQPTISQDTAEKCMELVNWFLRDNEGWRVEPVAEKDGVSWRLTDRPKMRGGGDR